MNKIRKRFWGYSPAEVDEFLDNCEQQRKKLAEQKYKNLREEIAGLEKELEEHNKEELKIMESLTLGLIDNDGVVQQARRKSQAMKEMAVHNLKIQEEKLLTRQKSLQDVYENLAKIKGNLHDVDKFRRPLTIVTKGEER